mmetsp:Transcript_16469/g.27961  ORF Transcript_16469/g.27961 Transcript_16469/m.27961 type:complete len:280 (+) Transcript_16469:980-1819(+)
MAPSRVYDDIDMVTMYGAFYLILVPLSVFIIVFDELIREKIDHLRQGMELLGTQNGAYWASWVVSATFLNVLVNSEFCLLATYYYKFSVFVRSPLPVNLLMMILVTQAYVMMACFFTTVTNSRTTAFSINFSLVLVSLVINIIISEPSTLKKIFYNKDSTMVFKTFTWIFHLNPCFHFAKMFQDITNVACSSLNPKTVGWEKSTRHFDYSDIFLEQEGAFFTQEKYHVPSLLQTSCETFYICLMYVLLAWYFDSILSQNRGVPQPKLFFLSPFYWIPSL